MNIEELKLEGDYNHSDDDKVDAQVEYNLKMALKRQQAEAKKNLLPPTGFCHNCGATLESDTKLFCDKECAEEHAYMEERKKANGL